MSQDPVSEAELRARMFYAAPSEWSVKRHRAVQEGCYELALKLKKFCPNSRELNIAIRKLEEVRMWGSAAIAHRQARNDAMGLMDYPEEASPTTSEGSFEPAERTVPVPPPRSTKVLLEVVDDEDDSDPFTGAPLEP